MAKYIDADALMDRIYGRQIAIKYNCCGVELHAQGLSTADIFGIIEGLPAADVEPVRHGKWLDAYGDCSNANCSLCGHQLEVIWEDADNVGPAMRKSMFREFQKSYHYCPHCGAKMDADQEDT
ncbi:MAG: hypothetical protein LUC48_09680 [Clostridiales bacterium]|nr:hypothetical protein [Clostridiales bacterium]